MSTLKYHEKCIFEILFYTEDWNGNHTGSVLDFTDSTFAEFFREHNININDQKYQKNGPSHSEHLRAFWELEPDSVVGNVLDGLLKYTCAIADIPHQPYKTKALNIIKRLRSENPNNLKDKLTEETFLEQNFGQTEISKLSLDSQLQPVIAQRINEIQISLKRGAFLGAIFLCGSTLEGLLINIANKYPESFNTSDTSPKDANGSVKLFRDWTLNDLINTAYNIGLLSLDVKKFGHTLKDFRNYIHPRQQARQKFNPDMHTAKISWQVLQAAIADLSKQRTRQ